MGVDKFNKLLSKHDLSVLEFMLMKKEWEGLSISQKEKIIRGKLNSQKESV